MARDSAAHAADALLSLALRLAWLMGGLLASDPEHNLTLRTLRILYRLDQGPRRAGELASSAGMTAPAVTVAVAALQRQGWVRRQPDPGDRRATLVSLTDAGQRALREGERRLEAILARITGELDGESVEALLMLEEPLHAGIDHVREHLGKDPEGIPRPMRGRAQPTSRELDLTPSREGREAP